MRDGDACLLRFDHRGRASWVIWGLFWECINDNGNSSFLNTLETYQSMFFPYFEGLNCKVWPSIVLYNTWATVGAPQYQPLLYTQLVIAWKVYAKVAFLKSNSSFSLAKLVR